MRSIGIRKNHYSFLLAFLFLGIFNVSMAQASAVPSYGQEQPAPWRTLEWLTNRATVFTNAGVTWLGTKIDESVQTTGDYVGWGTGTHTAAKTDTTLNTEDSAGSPAYARVAATRSVTTVTVTGDTIQWVASITSNGTKTIKEAANFTASTSGTMLVYGDFTGISLLVNDIIQFTITLQITN